MELLGLILRSDILMSTVCSPECPSAAKILVEAIGADRIDIGIRCPVKQLHNVRITQPMLQQLSLLFHLKELIYFWIFHSIYLQFPGRKANELHVLWILCALTLPTVLN